MRLAEVADLNVYFFMDRLYAGARAPLTNKSKGSRNPGATGGIDRERERKGRELGGEREKFVPAG